jgi:predicted AAA+ superfamily ATPase
MTIEREIESAIRSLMGKYPIIALTGPRQSGKTTLLKTLFPDFRYVSLENPDNRSFAESDPNGFLSKYNNAVIFDEVQRVPSLFSYLQTLVDESGRMGQFILSGSQNFHLMHNITQSLAGRVAIFRLFPFDLQELNKAGWLTDDYLTNLVKGFYPAIYDRGIQSRTFYSNYVQTYVQRDVSELVAIKDMRLFKNFIALCATRAGQLLNLNSLANECGISQPTAKSWLSALENSYIVFTLQPYHQNFSKRIVKSPKLYFYDSGLLCYLLKISSPEQIIAHPFKGSLFENMMIAEYIKRMHHKNEVQDCWFWRDSAGHEVDLVVQNGLTLDLVEFKSTQTIMSDLFKGLQYFENLAKDIPLTKTLVYSGSEYQKRTVADVVPWRAFGK